MFCHAGGVKAVKEILSAFPPPGEELLQALTSVLHVLSIHNEIIRRIFDRAYAAFSFCIVLLSSLLFPLYLYLFYSYIFF